MPDQSKPGLVLLIVFTAYLTMNRTGILQIIFTRRCANLILLFSSFGSLLPAAAQPDSETERSDNRRIKVLSFNIRYGTANDGINRWQLRRDRVIQLIREFDPDLLGVQESLDFQTDFLKEQLPSYEVVGVGRDDGQRQGEMVAVFFRKHRFQQIDAGHFWLSESPAEAGSRSWDSAITRMATWVRVKDLQDSRQRELVFLNTHFDHIGATARHESAKLVRQKLQQHQGSPSLIVTGDFNAAEGSQPYRALLDDSDSGLRLIDTYRRVHVDKQAGEGTSSNFRSDQIQGARIDWIVVSADWKVEAATIDRTAHEGRTPSDHFPVTATLAWPD